jgi:hypothetical protein
MAKAVLILVAVATYLSLSPPVHAHGDPVSDQLLEGSIALPVNAKIDSVAVRRLATAVRDANQAGFRIKVAVVAEPADLGPLFDLFRRPQQFAESLGRDLFGYRGGLLVVMPNGYGYVFDGARHRRSSRALAALPEPGQEPTNQAEAGRSAVRRLAAVAGHPPGTPERDNTSETSDRITIAAAAVAGVALAAALVLFRCQRRPRPD